MIILAALIGLLLMLIVAKLDIKSERIWIKHENERDKPSSQPTNAPRAANQDYS